MRVLVTGATGFLGGHLVRALIEAGHEPRALVRPGRETCFFEAVGAEVARGDLADEAGLRRAARGCDAVVHAAARTGDPPRDKREEQWRTNVDGTTHLVRAARAAKVGRIVHVSSIATIGASRDGTPLDEGSLWDGPPVDGVPYALTKIEAEQRALAAARAGADVVVVNPSSLIGPRADGRPSGGTLAAIAARAVKIVPPGGVSVADVEDVARGCVRALECGRAGERYILGGENLTYREFFARIAAAAGVPAPRFVLPRMLVPLLVPPAAALALAGRGRPPWTPGLMRAWGWFAYVDSSKARRELGYTCRPLDETVRRTLAVLR